MAEEQQVRRKYLQRWQCYSDIDKGESAWTREQYEIKYVQGGNRGPMITVSCSCGGEGDFDDGICVHRYRAEWLDRKNSNDLPEGESREWEVNYD